MTASVCSGESWICDQSRRCRDPGIDRSQRRHQIADIGVLGTKGGSEFVEDVGDVTRPPFEGHVRSNVAKEALPDMSVSIDESRHDNHPGRVDHLRLSVGEIVTDFDDSATLDQDIGFG